MKKLLSVSLCLLFAASMAAQTGKIRVATVGNSITGGTNDYGYYAMPLAEMLGDDYEVTKFGKGSSAVFIKLREDATTPEILMNINSLTLILSNAQRHLSINLILSLLSLVQTMPTRRTSKNMVRKHLRQTIKN